MGGKPKEPKTGRKGGPLGQTKRENIKKEITELISQGKYSQITKNKLAYAREKKINRNTLNKLLEELKSLVDEEIPELIKVDIIKTYERMKRRVMYWWDKCENAAEDEQSFHLEKQVFKEMREVLKDFRQTCIELGVIDKIADKVDINADITHKQVVINYNVPNGISNNTQN